MDPKDKGAAKFYEIFNVHEKHEERKAPPERPIISGSGSMTENIGLYFEHHTKELANKHPSYLQNKPDFLRTLQELNKKDMIQEGDTLVSVDVAGLYTSIPQDKRLKSVHEALNEKNDKETPSDFILKLFEMVLKYNIFEFNKELFI